MERSSQPPPVGYVYKSIPLYKEAKEAVNVEQVPIHLKVALTIKEAAEYSNIGINKIDRMLREPNCPFVLFVGSKRLVKRKEFEIFLSEKLVI